MTRVAIRRALISVYDKTGLDDLARSLHAAGVEIVSTGSTADTITAAGVPVTRVEDVTGFPEALDGRVKTLHPAVHAGLLADVGKPAHQARLDELGIEPFQLLVSNLYPFEAAVSSGAPPAECVEQIDIGGPAMVRAAAKNHAHVAVITDPSRYGDAEAAVAEGGFTLEQRRRLAARAYAHTAAYDSAVASWFASAYAPDETAQETGWPDVTAALWSRRDVLRYGENPHQRAALYVRSSAGEGRAGQGRAGQGSAGDGSAYEGRADGKAPAGIAGATQLHGKAMSYNNYVDAAAAWRAAFDFIQPCVAIIKHSNPCGIALGTDLAEAHRKANACDPQSAFGGVIAANSVVTANMAAQVKDIFTEIVIAPGFEDDALDILSGSKNLRLLTCPPPVRGAGVPEWRQVDGGLLLQTPDEIDAPGDDPASWELKTGQPASPDMLADLAFAWRAIRSVKSNAILLASGLATVGVGMGQVNRLDAARLAVSRAGERAAGSVAASDAYFPFPDGLEVLTSAGVRAVVQPGGSIRDQLSIEAAEQAGITMYVTGVRHFFH
ncbi:MAG: phosphoribosylaminoimidazolecarboxamide formyltransferase / cyclohydrolase [Streptosporangiaceae bacterium]|nr:phosphoribosylaminoimidazolecarboxamide formyltransferase / cyclohydrolase [Streptosporangiaceae bacterium]